MLRYCHHQAVLPRISLTSGVKCLRNAGVNKRHYFTFISSRNGLLQSSPYRTVFYRKIYQQHGTPSPVRTLPELVGKTLCYVTDVEGNIDYWTKWKTMSRAVKRNNDQTQVQDLELRDNYYLVYGGDVWDRGKGDLRIISELVALKKKYPDRVFFILGNRDINKLRLLSELAPAAVSSEMVTYWTRRVPHGQEPSTGSPTADRLRVILKTTMGCPHSFEFRREELRDLGVIASSDSVQQQAEKIAASYIEALRPGGVMSEYLRLGDISVLLGDCLFVHGGIHAPALGWVPPPTSGRAKTAREWVLQLRAFHSSEMKDLLSGPERRKRETEWDHLYVAPDAAVLRDPFVLSSQVVAGFKRGSTELGFPTANLCVESLAVTYPQGGVPAAEKLQAAELLDTIRTGIYVGYASIRSQDISSPPAYYPCVVSIGWNPVYGNTYKTVEAHLLDIDIGTHLPHQSPLPSHFYDELISCIEEDVARAKEYFPLMLRRINKQPDSETPQGNLMTSANISLPWSAWGGYGAPHSGGRLMQYGMGRIKGGRDNPTVIYDNFLNNGSPQPPDEAVLSFLAKSGVFKVFSGHQPHGDSPLVMTCDAHDLVSGLCTNQKLIQFFTCDTSYANDVHIDSSSFDTSKASLGKLLAYNNLVSEDLSNQSETDKEGPDKEGPVDTRGNAVAEVAIHFTYDDKLAIHSQVSVYGELNNRIQYDWVMDCSTDRRSSRIGKSFVREGSEWWVKGVITLPRCEGRTPPHELKRGKQNLGVAASGEDLNTAEEEVRCASSRVSGGTREELELGGGEGIFLICKSEGRDVYNSFVAEKELCTLMPDI